ncbi:hypothetical protein DM01DRAFT_1370293 [Hesseltinella vesiculosa]|uniref:Cyanovirin-N domain-containing protein n=1 Tax=Hesseltinella vesiculosa TaxID=101127 RepID=A0A1X2GWP8_9FUNG|nr:hypothetical protein DM01DRAFT_1370293 [Hesseltinella vesiculosa]
MVQMQLFVALGALVPGLLAIPAFAPDDGSLEGRRVIVDVTGLPDTGVTGFTADGCEPLLHGRIYKCNNVTEDVPNEVTVSCNGLVDPHFTKFTATNCKQTGSGYYYCVCKEDQA